MIIIVTREELPTKFWKQNIGVHSPLPGIQSEKKPASCNERLLVREE